MGAGLDPPYYKVTTRQAYPIQATPDYAFMFSSSYGIGVGGAGTFDYLISQNLESVNCQYHTYYGKFSELSADGGSEKQKLVCGTPDAPRTQNIGVRHVEAWTVPGPQAG